MIFTKKEKNEVVEYVASAISELYSLENSVATKLVMSSILMKKMDESPSFVAHCSVEQLVDFVIKDQSVTCH